MTKLLKASNSILNQVELSFCLFLILFILSATLTYDKVAASVDAERRLLSHKEITADIDVLVEYLDNAYAGQYIFSEKYQELKKSLLDYKVNYSNPVTVKRFEKDLNWMRQNFPDGHLRFVKMRAEKFRQQVSMNKRFLSYEFKNIKSAKVLTIKIPTFLISEEDEFLEIEKILQQNIMTIDYLILDLSDNGGGYSVYAARIASTIWNSKFLRNTVIQPFPTPYRREIQLGNKYTEDLFNNYDLKYGLNEIKFFNQKSIDTKKSESTNPLQSISVNTHFDFKGPDKNQVPIRPKQIFLITKDTCASACERLIEQLEFHPRFTHLGDTTAGSTQLGNVGLLTLPNSDLSVAISTRALEYYDNRIVENVGYKPKLRLESIDGEFLPTVYRYIEKNFK